MKFIIFFIYICLLPWGKLLAEGRFIEHEGKNYFIPHYVISPRSPTINDNNYKIGQIWINTKVNYKYILDYIKENEANWIYLRSGGPDMKDFEMQLKK